VTDSDSHGTSHTLSDTESESVTHGITRGVSIAKGVSETRSKSTARSRQQSTGLTTGETVGSGESYSTGWSEAMVPILALRASAVHGKDNVLYLAAQTLRSLKTGTALINFVDHTGMNSALLRVPVRTVAALSEGAFAALINAIASASPSAQPAAQAKEALRTRRLTLTKAARQLRLPAPEPVNARAFRVVRPPKTRPTPDRGDDDA
jgi:hypothetical protein